MPVLLLSDHGLDLLGEVPVVRLVVQHVHVSALEVAEALVVDAYHGVHDGIDVQPFGNGII